MELSDFPDVEGISTRTANVLRNQGWSLPKLIELMETDHGRKQIKAAPNFGRKCWFELLEFFQVNGDCIREFAAVFCDNDVPENVVASSLDYSREYFLKETFGVFREMKYQYRAMIEAEIQKAIREEMSKMGLHGEIRGLIAHAVQKMAAAQN
jgi:hypothetical protein